MAKAQFKMAITRLVIVSMALGAMDSGASRLLAQPTDAKKQPANSESRKEHVFKFPNSLPVRSAGDVALRYFGITAESQPKGAPVVRIDEHQHSVVVSGTANQVEAIGKVFDALYPTSSNGSTPPEVNAKARQPKQIYFYIYSKKLTKPIRARDGGDGFVSRLANSLGTAMPGMDGGMGMGMGMGGDMPGMDGGMGMDGMGFMGGMGGGGMMGMGMMDGSMAGGGGMSGMGMGMPGMGVPQQKIVNVVACVFDDAKAADGRVQVTVFSAKTVTSDKPSKAAIKIQDLALPDATILVPFSELIDMESEKKSVGRKPAERSEYSAAELKIIESMIKTDVWKERLLDELEQVGSSLNASMESSLRELLTEEYDAQIAMQQLELQTIEQRVGKLREELNRRRIARDRVIDVQVGKLTLEAEGLLKRDNRQ